MVSRPWGERLLDCIFPPTCPGCGADGYGFCAACRAQLVPQHETVGDVDIYAAGLYQKELRRALLQTKLCGYTYFSYALAEVMREALPVHLRGEFPVTVIPMPPVPKRWRRRGYHCPYLLAKELVRALDKFSYNPGALALTRSTQEQKLLSRAERFANMRGAYRAEGVRGLYTLLVDDVLTTGASAHEAAQALYEAGALKVDVLVLGIRK